MTFLKPEQKKWIIWVLRGLFLIYLFVLLYRLFLSERYGRTDGCAEYRYNLVPFREIKRYIYYYDKLGHEAFFINIYGNVLAFLPFGFLVPIISSRKKGFFAVLFLSAALTLTVETTQLVGRVGSFDVDDMILNILGGMLGFLLYKLSILVWRRLIGWLGV